MADDYFQYAPLPETPEKSALMALGCASVERFRGQAAINDAVDDRVGAARAARGQQHERA